MTRLPLAASLAASLATFLTAAPAVAHADPCHVAARRDLRECRAACLETFQTAKDACLNRDHACVESCRAGRAGCVEAIGLGAAIDACNDALQAARQTCRATYAEGAERDACIDQAQAVAFQCRDAAREVARPGLLACREAFRTCALGCPPASDETMPPAQCRRQAVRELNACLKACREDGQVARDACANRDHACVEDCRNARHACLEPIRATADAAVSACKAERDAAVANCVSLYADGTPERDQCVDNAQVAAFQCRDAAREAAKPGTLECRRQFRACEQACPPPAEP